MLPISHIPHEPGIYIFKDKSWDVLYIGKAKNLHKRVQQYFTPGSVWKQEMLHRAASVEYVSVHNESEALYLESNLIKEHQPPFNSLLKWDNSYCFIKIPKEDFPPILITRKRSEDWAIYIWPKHNRNHIKEFLQYLRQILKFRTMKASIFRQGKLDSDFYFGLDKWWSVIAKLKTTNKNSNELVAYAQQQWLVIDKSYEEYKEEYTSIIKQIVAFFRGNTKPIKQTILTHINEAITSEHFERAAKLRDIYTKIDELAEKQTVVVDQHISWTIGHVQTLGGWTVFVLFKVFEGKIIDIIKHKERSDDMDIAAFIATLQKEYGEMVWYDTDYIKISVTSSEARSIGDNNVIPAPEPGSIDSGSSPEWQNSYTSPLWRSSKWQLFFVDKQIKKIKKDVRASFFVLLQKSFEDFVAVSSFEKESMMNDILKSLQINYKLSIFPYRIECVDISHLSGWWMSGWLSCLVWWLKNPKWYRRYKIKSIKTLDQQNNDYLALEEVITRRLWIKAINDGWYIPDLFIIDGWKGQLAVVQKLIQAGNIHPDAIQQTQFVWLGKGDARKRAGKNAGAKEELLILNGNSIESNQLSYNESDKILLTARDESHRFANAYRKKQMSKEWK
jgi:excinuclease ABC subunit C